MPLPLEAAGAFGADLKKPISFCQKVFGAGAEGDGRESFRERAPDRRGPRPDLRPEPRGSWDLMDGI